MFRTALGSLAALLVVLGCTPRQRDHSELARRMVEAINARALDALDAVIAPDVVRHSAATPDVVVENLEQFKAFLRQDLTGVPDARITVERMFGDGEHVAMLARYTGTQTGQMGPFPPSARRIDLPFIGIVRIEDEKIAEMWVEWDNLSMLTALGHLAAPVPATGAEQ